MNKLSALDWQTLEGLAAPWIGAGATPGAVVGAFVGTIFPLAGMLLLLYLIYGGYNYLLSGGDPKKTAKAQGIITTAILGFVIVFVSFWIVQIIGRILGIEQIINIFG
jgi:hypothetical protein